MAPPKVHPLLKRETKGLRFLTWFYKRLDKHIEDHGGSRGTVLEAAAIKVHKWKPPTRKELEEK